MNLNSTLRKLIVAAALLQLAACASTPSGKSEVGDAAATETAQATATPAAHSGEAAPVVVSSDPNAPLERRATDRWKLLVAREGKRAYEYLTPGYRATQTVKEYEDWVLGRQIAWTQALYQDHNCVNPESCKVGMQLTARVKLRGVGGEHETTTYVSEQWLKVDGVWYHLPKDAL